MKLTVFKKRNQPLADGQLSLFDKAYAALLLMWRIASPEKRRRVARRSRTKHRPRAAARFALPQLQQLEAREMLYGYIQAQGEGPYTALNTETYTAAAPGVLSRVTGNDPPFTAHLVTQAAHGTVTVQSNGAWSYTADTGYSGPDSFQYDASDSQNDTSGAATVSLNVIFGALSDVDQTKLPADTLQVPMQILGDSSGQPATAANLSLVYHSGTAQPTQALEEDFQPSMEPVQSAMLQVAGTFNGSSQNSNFVSTSDLSGNDPTIRLSLDVNTAGLSTDRYAYTQTVSSQSSMGATLISTLNGAANVVNDQSSPFGAGWEMPGMYHLYQNTASNVPAGVLLTPGDGTGWYFTAGTGNTYTSPNGPYAFDTLTSLSGGGWQLVDKFGTTYVFNSAG
ncbi:MAG: Ig-like domain-containing protein, partial [Pirellulales bacterium]